MDAFARRLALWRLLAAASEPVALRALADRFDVSKHTIRRDVDALSRAGVPVEEERRGQAVLFFVRKAGS
ncbi:MAG TPA: helix-turn-helix domain-containing protein [Anaeromyxobacteraceae bacterium]|nr:helix-turn-helix domain-containing protein [Anaeromyxobacteraceae bacterium]